MSIPRWRTTNRSGSGVKLKRGSSLVFSSESKAEQTKIDASQIEVIVDSVTLPKQRSWFGRNISSIFRKKNKTQINFTLKELFEFE